MVFRPDHKLVHDDDSGRYVSCRLGTQVISSAACARALKRNSKARFAVPIDIKSWIRADDYPPAALANGTSGISGAQMLVSPDGSITDCSIMQSGGSLVLDETTCALLRSRAHFIPGRDFHGRPVTFPYFRRFSWHLPN